MPASRLLNRRALRPLTIAALTVTALVATTACQPGEQPAATVNGHQISAADLRADLQAEVAAAKKGGTPPQGLLGVGKDTFASSAAAERLSVRVRSEILRELLAKMKVTVMAKDRTDGAAQVCSSGSPNCLDAYPKRYQDFIKLFASRFVAFQRAYLAAHPKAPAPTAPTSTDEQLAQQARQQYDQAVAQDPTLVENNVCYVAALFPDEPSATAARAQIDAGTPFADAVNATPGSRLGQQSCVQQSQAPQVLAGVTAGQILGPLQDQSGPVLVQVTKLGTATFEDFQPALIQQLRQQEQQAQQQAATSVDQQTAQAAQRELVDGAAKIDVSVNPRYGRWVPKSLSVVAPTPPKGSVTTTTTAPAPAGGSSTGGSAPTTTAPAPTGRSAPASGSAPAGGSSTGG